MYDTFKYVYTYKANDVTVPPFPVSPALYWLFFPGVLIIPFLKMYTFCHTQLENTLLNGWDLTLSERGREGYEQIALSLWVISFSIKAFSPG